MILHCIFCYWDLSSVVPEGYYVYIEASSRRQNESAQIKSPRVSPSTGSNTRCLTFWYSMFGPNIGALNLYTQTQAILGNPVWKRRGNQGNQWRQAQVTVSLAVPFNVSISSSWVLFFFMPDFFFFWKFSNCIDLCHVLTRVLIVVFFFQFVFEGKVGNSYRGDIALDDVKLTNGPCSGKFECGPRLRLFCMYWYMYILLQVS